MPAPLVDPSLFQTGPERPRLNIPLNPIRYDNSGRVNADMDNLISRAVGTGDVLEEEFREVGPYFMDLLRRYEPMAFQAYQSRLTGGAGYTPEEQAAIQQNERLNRMDYRPDEAAQLFLTPEEQSAIAGDPYKIFEYFNPEAIRGQWSDFRDRGREAIDAAQLGVSPEYAGRLRSILSQTGSDADVNEEALRLREGFLDDFQLSDEDVGDMADLGARAASSRWDAAYSDIDRRASAAGGMGPAALATLRGRLDRHSNIDAADAATRARLEGTALQKQLLGQGEGMRLGSEQFIQDALLDRAFRLGDMALSAEGDIEGRRYTGERDRMDARLGHETNVGSAGLGMETGLQATGQNLFRYGDESTSNRNTTLGTNRQGAAQQGQYNTREYGFGAADRASSAAQTVADTRLQQEQSGLDFLERQQQLAAGGYSNAANRRTDGAIGMANAQLNAQADRRTRRGPSIYERVMFG